MKTLKSGFFFVTGFLACPCHLPLTLPLLLTLTAGTTIGLWLAQNTAVIVLLLSVYFVGALVLGFRSMNQTSVACETPTRRQGADEQPISAKSSAVNLG
jgi:mercuric ion transport protein